MTDPRRHNYFDKVQAIGAEIQERQARGEPPGLFHVEVLHDDWCHVRTGLGKYCNCDPHVSLLKDPPPGFEA